MITHLNSQYVTYLVSAGTANVFCNLKSIPKVTALLTKGNDNKAMIYQFIENGKTFAPISLEEIKTRIKNQRK